MRSLTISSFGKPSVLAVITEPIPEPATGQVRIQTAGAAVHPVDIGTRSGALAEFLPERDHYHLGWDLAGTVDAVGADTTGFSIGDPVVALSDWFDDLVGTQADYVVLDAAKVAAAPAGVSLTDAAGLPLNALAAAQALDLLALEPGQTLAVVGAAGSVGGYAVELAVHRDLRVLGIAGATDREFVTGLGGRFLPRSEDLATAVARVLGGGADGVLDTALVGDPALAAVRDGGVFVNVFGPAAPPAQRAIRVDAVSVRSDGRQLSELVELVNHGRLTLRPARLFVLEDAGSAHELLAKSGVREPIVLIP
jgi:NADPH:quinone reductase